MLRAPGLSGQIFARLYFPALTSSEAQVRALRPSQEHKDETPISPKAPVQMARGLSTKCRNAKRKQRGLWAAARAGL